jgi:TolA-binding protein
MNPANEPKTTELPKKKIEVKNEIKKEKKDSKAPLVAFIITTLLLLGASGYLFYDNNSIKEENAAQLVRIDSLNILKGNLQKEVTTFQEEVNQYKGKSQELENQLATANDDIEAKESKIRRMIVNNASISNLKKEIAELKALKENHLKTIADLESQLLALRTENEQLKASAAELNLQLGSLQQRNSELEKKVQVASALRTNNVIVIGEKKGKGNLYAPTKLKKAERLLITFDLEDNAVAEPGEKTIYITVTTPSGKIIEGPESGTFTNPDNNMSTPYSVMHKVSYNNAKQKVMVPVDLTNIEHAAGNYNIEFFSDGHAAGGAKLAVK